jgi:pimeloyl-ACP methyl ester carboxylesterase
MDFKYIESSVLSKDGTKIGFRQYGSGPAVILVQGAIGTTQSYHELAANLAADFEVYVPERRGRPMSQSSYDPDHVVEKEMEDLEALFERSGASFLFGLSAGAAIALEAARVFPLVSKLVSYEAPLHVLPHALRLDLVARLNREVDAGETSAAMVTALIASGFAPPLFNLIPRFLIEPALSLFLSWDERQTNREYPPLRQIVPTMQFDYGLISALQNKFETFSSITSDVLLMSCRKSPAYIRESARVLERSIPRARRIEFDGLTHAGPWNENRGGKPSMVAETMREFFKQ